MIRFCWKAGTFEMIQKVYGDSAVRRATVFHLYNTFLDGWESIRDSREAEDQ